MSCHYLKTIQQLTVLGAFGEGRKRVFIIMPGKSKKTQLDFSCPFQLVPHEAGQKSAPCVRADLPRPTEGIEEGAA